ncbi:putative membrane protein [Rhodoferax antarcticus ANT.BR]|uniref:Putative membrane protein n=1 Tax=Rhodoferax antarcticus ANT.BR TaxID=1111071 RepID=A0A1Q8YGE8_9BURK|nr:putative membrane protein [Rhodoferax antarcticus ANT.BR]
MPGLVIWGSFSSNYLEMIFCLIRVIGFILLKTWPFLSGRF